VIIYRADINGREATVERISIKSKKQLINALTDAHHIDCLLYGTEDEMPFGCVFRQTKEGILQEVKELFSCRGFSLGRCTIEFKSNKGKV